MKGLKLILVMILALLPVTLRAQELDMNEYLFGHVGDSYGWHVTTIKGHPVCIHLPVIVHSKATGWHVFSSKHIEEGEEYEGFRLAGEDEKHSGKLVEVTSLGIEKPLDISITKNVFGLFINSLIVLVVILLGARWYRKHDAREEAPGGFAGLVEMVVMMIEDDVIKPCVGHDYKRYSPYLLTAFFFIFINNLMGIIPFFPGGANITGNIAVTLCLALCTFLAVNLFGNRHYYKEIFWPDVPIFLKAFPLMPLIEIVGMFTKPFSLMVRLFANILAGHMMILGVLSVIFITASMGAVLNGSLTFIAVLFGVFMDVLECLVAFIQAYVFTMLSSVFIGLSRQEPEHE
ncbi:MAG: F0F1 ATP synthase subunit A [Bacteroidales bacterium]|nr:F0F1 ATP synthase subunit A [Candidatus Cryptobacteroides onthequi]MCQ2164445.1 F0F1 ATP synthase subunit A [Bacteroidales bacterium]